MKKNNTFLTISLFSFATIQAQQIHIGVSGGLPVGSAEETYNGTVGADFSYLFSVSDKFHVGPVVSVAHYFGKDERILDFIIDNENVTFIPVGAEARYMIKDFYIGGEVAYGIGFEPSTSGLFFKPFAGYMFSKYMGIKASFSRMTSDSNNINSVNLGINLVSF